MIEQTTFSSPGTVSERRMEDDVPDAEKRRRYQVIEDLQKEVSAEKTARFLGDVVEVLVESRDKSRWRGRTPHNKLVFFDDPRPLRGQMVPVRITHAGPWSMSGEVIDDRQTVSPQSTPTADSIPLSML